MAVPLIIVLALAACSPQLLNVDAQAPAETQATLAPTALLASPTAAAAVQAQPTQEATQPPATQALQATAAQAAPTCSSPAELTPAETEGPYFKANSPERASLLESGTTGTKLVLTGYVLTADCKPIAGALLDFWQADAQGNYDNAGYTMRGHQFTDANGAYKLETVIPGLYTGRTEHIHVKVQAPNGPILTSQLFFPGVQQNDSDSIFNDKLLIQIQDAPDGKQGSFTFIWKTQ
jgi:protocatechuate 3,4-dioxygenase beta subunit